LLDGVHIQPCRTFAGEEVVVGPIRAHDEPSNQDALECLVQLDPCGRLVGGRRVELVRLDRQRASSQMDLIEFQSRHLIRGETAAGY
jgi:hypothetical protein